MATRRADESLAAGNAFDVKIRLFVRHTFYIETRKKVQYCDAFTLSDTRADTETERDTGTDKLIQNPMGICVDVYLYTV